MAQYQAEVRVSTDFTIFFDAEEGDDLDHIANGAVEAIAFETNYLGSTTIDGTDVEIVYDGPYDNEVVQDPWTDDEDEDDE